MEILKILREVRRIKKNMKLSREEVLQMQQEKLHNLIEHALKNSKFYREYYEKHGINLENYKEISFEKYPTITKDMIMENFDDILCTGDVCKRDLEKFIGDKKNLGKKYKGKYTVATSSGSTGQPAIFVYDEKAWRTIKSFILGRVDPGHKLNILKKERVAFLILTGGPYAAYTLALEAQNINYETLIIDVHTPMDKMIEDLERFNPTIITGYASTMGQLAEVGFKRSLNIKPERIYCSADRLTDKSKKLIEKVFGVTPRNFYAATEALGMASQMENGKELFLFEDYYKLEVVDEFMRDVDPGGIGNLVVTNLYNYILPIVRYQMEDRLKKSKIQNHSYTLIEEIAGRVAEDFSFYFENGESKSIKSLKFVSMYFKGVEKTQFIQEERNTIRIKYVAPKKEEGIRKDIEGQMKKFLGANGLEGRVELRIERVEEIPVDERTGKFKQIIPYKE